MCFSVVDTFRIGPVRKLEAQITAIVNFDEYAPGEQCPSAFAPNRQPDVFVRFPSKTGTPTSTVLVVVVVNSPAEPLGVAAKADIPSALTTPANANTTNTTTGSAFFTVPTIISPTTTKVKHHLQ